MRLTALCLCGTLLAFSSLSWTTVDSDEGDLLWDNGFEPCAATLRPEGPCKHGQDESMCPYLFNLPPLTVQLPKQLRELEKIVTDLQKLKDSVDQLRKMCTDCTVSQNERECESKREREHDEPNEGTNRCKNERNWLNERNRERLKDVSPVSETDKVKGEKAMEDGDISSEKSIHLGEKGREEWEAQRESDEGVKNEDEEALKEVEEKDGKTQRGKAKERNKLGQTRVPNSDGYERMPDIVRKRVGEKNNTEREANRKKGKAGDERTAEDEENLLENRKEGTTISNTKIKEKADDHRVRHDETKGTERKTQTEEERGGDGIKMSEDHGEHTNKEQELRREERKKEMEKGIKVERNNEKPKQTESIGRAEKETIKEGEVEEEEDRQTGKEIKKETEKKDQSVQRDSDGELVPSRTTESTDFVSISPTPHSVTPGHESRDLNEAVTSASYIPHPSLSSSTSHMIAGVDQGVTTKSLGLSEHQSSDDQGGLRSRNRPVTAATVHTLGGPEQETTSTTTRFISPTSTRPRAATLGEVSSTSASTTTTAPLQPFTTTAFTGVTDRNSWTTTQNIISNAKTFSGREPKPGEKHKATIKTEADRKLSFPKNDHRPDRAPLPDRKTGQDQKKKPSHQKPTTDQRSKPGKDAKTVQIPKQSQRPLPDHLLTDRNLKNVQIPKYDQINTTDPNQFTHHKPKSHRKSVVPVQRPTSQQTPQTVSTAGPDKGDIYHTPESVEIPVSNQKPKPEKRPGHTFKPDKSGQKQKTPQKPKNDDKTRPDQGSTIKQSVTPAQEPEPDGSEAIRFIPKPTQKPVTESSDHFNENPSPELKPDQDSSPGKKLSSDRDPIKPPDQRLRPSQKIPKINQKADPVTGQKTKPSLKPKPDQTPQTNQGFKMPRQDRAPDLSSKSVSDENPEAESNRTSTAMPLPRHRPPTRPTVKPGATSVQRPKPSEQLQPSPKTKTDLHPPQISRTTSDGIQNSQTDKPPASGPVKHIADVTHSPEFSPSEMKTSTLGPKPSADLDTRPFPNPNSLSEGFTMSPNSRITSDLRPQTASQAPSIPMTTRPNKITHGFLPSVILSTSPGSTQPKQVPDTDSRPKTETLYSAEETASTQAPDPDKMRTPVPSLRTQSTSTTSPHLRSTASTTSGPEPLVPEASSPSPHELRVKINQVAAFFNNSLSPNGRPLERLPVEQPEVDQGGSRPEWMDGKLPTLRPKKVPAVKRDCSDYLPREEARSGVYLVTPDLRSRSFQVFCDMELQGGGWTVLQRRQDGSVSFNRSWAEYRAGFGQLDSGEFWLGNNMIHLLTRDRDMKLRVELEDFEGVMEFAEYEHFRVASERMRYRLTVDGYSGTAGDALRFSRSYDHNNRAFTTPDKDHDRYPSGNCGAYYSSGWWFDACMAANLNGRYYVGKYKGVRDGIFWGTWHNISMEYYPTNDRQAFKRVRMLIRPTGFAP